MGSLRDARWLQFPAEARVPVFVHAQGRKSILVAHLFSCRPRHGNLHFHLTCMVSLTWNWSNYAVVGRRRVCSLRQVPKPGPISSGCMRLDGLPAHCWECLLRHSLRHVSRSRRWVRNGPGVSMACRTLRIRSSDKPESAVASTCRACRFSLIMSLVLVTIFQNILLLRRLLNARPF